MLKRKVSFVRVSRVKVGCFKEETFPSSRQTLKRWCQSCPILHCIHNTLISSTQQCAIIIQNMEKCLTFSQQAEHIRTLRDRQLSQCLIKIIPHVKKIPKTKLQSIANASCTQLVLMLNEGETTSEELVYVFAFRAATIGLELRAVTEDNFMEALQMARNCDRKRKQTGFKNAPLLSSENEEVLPHLFGIPISIKDTVNMKGFASTIGCVARYKLRQERDGAIVTVLKGAGMIPFVRSNVQQLCMSYESNNALWGNSQNPWDRTRTPGGSSGGEGALVAARCSPIGLGGDIGGSLRIPAEFCGVCTLKSTSQRITSGGHTSFSPSIDGQINVRAVFGPITKSVQDLALFLKTLMDDSHYNSETRDVYRKLIPFDCVAYKTVSQNQRKLRIGYYDSFEIFPTSKASARAVHEAVEILKNQGHTLVPIKIPNADKIPKVLISLTLAEGGLRGYEEILDGEPLAKEYRISKLALLLPKCIHWLLCKILSYTNPRMAVTLSEAKKLSTYQYLGLSHKQQLFRDAFMEMWRAQNLDFIVGPGFGLQACKIGTSNKMSFLPTMYTNIWNVLDMTAGSLPITRVLPAEEPYESQYRDLFSMTARENMKGTTGLPVGIQVISLPYHDQKVLGLMKVIEQQVRFRDTHPFPI